MVLGAQQPNKESAQKVSAVILHLEGNKITLHFKQNSQVVGKLGAVRKKMEGASLVAQWLGICLPMQGTRVRALVWEDPTCHGATGPVSHNY